MNTVFSRAVGTMGLLGMSAVALAGEPKPGTPHEPIGFVTGGGIGAFAARPGGAGPVGAVVGAGLGTWLGNRVHRAGDAAKAEASAAALQTDKTELLGEKSALLNEKNALAETNRTLTARLDDLTHKVESAQVARENGGEVLDG